ncbi:Mannose-6-phosphate isomerase ManC [Helicobacter sp. NHP19-012]|uniref:mannose-1-phosphate guanylyltransferase n=1 Tax=Helicobacter gastrofelis TaxID=2849642 RepID=A0ABM7SP04_9HELI|nr:MULTISPECIES: mannose-1-phosphate guanylyltransferase/mannose-6-phosphate isomerase [unclassified Helicobacter]BCZ19323.1 Mannose-6-phosphate isomerase ManC [Helicobacter sp. NHP19-012]GMB96097.1 Mannose-6-phosphate isomerase ManC [Helicobacter sp. NHP22-001]
MVHVVLSGGSGKRLWPLSREHFPKQFLKLYGEQSLFGLALERLKSPNAKFLVVCNEVHYFHALEEITKAHLEKHTQFLLESAGKNTMNALMLAALACDSNEILVISPTDHIMDKEAFNTALQTALDCAKNNHMVLFGIAKKPSNQYGFMRCEKAQNGVCAVLDFIEKPTPEEIAKLQQEDGDFYINSGMFVFKAGVFLEACKQHAPQMLEACKKVYLSAKKLPTILKCEDMADLEEGSVDVLLWQKCKGLKLVPLDAHWQDVGHFASLQASLPADDVGNVAHQGTLLNLHAKHNYTYSTPDKLVCLLGLENCVVVDSKDALLVATKTHLDHLKELVLCVGEKYPNLLKTYPLEYRPWGSFEVLLERPFFKVKLLEITPHKRLSLQKHQHRSEHWVVVEGVASVVVGEKSLSVPTNESVFIKQGQIHRLGNDTDQPLKILEVQCGAILDENDIERLHDDYQRP